MHFLRSNVLGLVAIFVALCGVAIAVEKNSVKSRHIARGAVQSSDVRNDTKPKGALRGNDVAADSLTGSDIDESTLGEVPSAGAVGGIDPAGLTTGAAAVAIRNLHSGAVQAAFTEALVVPGIATLQMRCSALNPSRWVVRIRNDSPVRLDLESRDGEVAHLSDATNPIPPFGPETESLDPGETSSEVELNDATNADTFQTWHLLNNHMPANLSPLRFLQLEILVSGSASNCFASLLAISSR